MAFFVTSCNFIQVYALIKKATYVGNISTNRFVIENFRIVKIFPRKITILGKMGNFKFSSLFTKMNYTIRKFAKKLIDVGHLNDWYEFRNFSV